MAALNSAKRPFAGSLNAAIVAAGFEPAKPGPKRRTDVDPEQAHRAVISPEGRAMLAAALAQAREAERRVSALEAKLERALRLAAERDAARGEGRRTVTAPVKPKVVGERVVGEAAVARAQRRAAAVQAKADATVRGIREQCAEARMDAAEARTAAKRMAAKRMAAKLERAEATIGTLRGERRELKDGQDRLTATERMLDRARVEAERVPEVVTVREQAPDAIEVRGARAEAARERRIAAEAELRADRGGDPW